MKKAYVVNMTRQVLDEGDMNDMDSGYYEESIGVGLTELDGYRVIARNINMLREAAKRIDKESLFMTVDNSNDYGDETAVYIELPEYDENDDACGCFDGYRKLLFTYDFNVLDLEGSL